MRKLVLQMMTTLNGRLDAPYEWMDDVADDQYRQIEAFYAEYDTVLVGRTTYEEMVGYWPGALASGEGTETNRRMAQHMHDYRKLVFSRSGEHDLTPWHNSEPVVAADDAALGRAIESLKAEPGKDIHLSGGAALAQAMIGLGLVDELRLFVYPTMSPGKRWFDGMTARRDFRVLASTSFSNGVTLMRLAAGETAAPAVHERFTELLTDKGPKASG